MISLIMKKIPAEKIFWQVFFFFCKVFEEGFRKEKSIGIVRKETLGKVVWSACSKAIAIT